MGRLFHWLAERIIERAKRHPYSHLFHQDGAPYMERFWLMPGWALKLNSSGEYERRRWVPFAFRVHHTMSSDYDRDNHCHPWPNYSLILKDWYIEVTPRDQAQPAEYDHRPGWSWEHRRSAGDFIMRKATDRHRLILPPGRSCWSLFWMGRKTKEWYFHTKNGPVHWRDYINSRESMS